MGVLRRYLGIYGALLFQYSPPYGGATRYDARILAGNFKTHPRMGVLQEIFSEIPTGRDIQKFRKNPTSVEIIRQLNTFLDISEKSSSENLSRKCRFRHLQNRGFQTIPQYKRMTMRHPPMLIFAPFSPVTIFATFDASCLYVNFAHTMTRTGLAKGKTACMMPPFLLKYHNNTIHERL